MSKEVAIKPETGRDFSFESLYKILRAKFTTDKPASTMDVVNALVDNGRFTMYIHSTPMNDVYPSATGISFCDELRSTQIKIYPYLSTSRKGREKIADIEINDKGLRQLLLSGKLKPGDAEWKLGRILGLKIAEEEAEAGTAKTTRPSSWGARVLGRLGI